MDWRCCLLGAVLRCELDVSAALVLLCCHSSSSLAPLVTGCTSSLVGWLRSVLGLVLHGFLAALLGRTRSRLGTDKCLASRVGSRCARCRARVPLRHALCAPCRLGRRPYRMGSWCCARCGRPYRRRCDWSDWARCRHRDWSSRPRRWRGDRSRACRRWSGGRRCSSHLAGCRARVASGSRGPEASLVQ